MLHAGAFVIQDIAGRRELVGPEVVVAHRLLKSRAAELIGHNAYALVTDAASTALGIPDENAVELAESYDDHSVNAQCSRCGTTEPAVYENRAISLMSRPERLGCPHGAETLSHGAPRRDLDGALGALE